MTAAPGNSAPGRPPQIVCLVPAKHLGSAKQRLTPHLSHVERRDLAKSMLEDVLHALVRISRTLRNSVLRTTVVTSDPDVARLAGDLGFDTMPDEGAGETDVINAASRQLERTGARGSLVLPGDVPLATVNEVEQILAAAPARGTVLVPSRSGRGSNAVLRIPPALFPLRFGNDSFRPHLAAARATGLPCGVLELPGIGLDIDGFEDLHELIERAGTTRTQAYLSGSGIADRLRQPHRG